MMNMQGIAFLGGIGAVAGCCIVIFSVWCSARRAERMKRLEVMERALEHPALDEETRRELVRTLAADHVKGRRSAAGIWGRVRAWGRPLLLAGGWILFVFAGALLVLMKTGVMHGNRWDYPYAWLLLAVGFIAMSLPIAMRELLARSAPLPSRQQ